MAIAYEGIANIYDDLGDYARLVEYNRKVVTMYQELDRVDPKNALLREGLAECVAAVVQAEAKGATWVFEDA